MSDIPTSEQVLDGDFRLVIIDEVMHQTDAPEGHTIEAGRHKLTAVHSRKATGGSDNWETPDKDFLPIHREFCFDVDVAADATNHKLPLWMGPGSDLGPDALASTWNLSPEVQGHFGVTMCFCNPPHSLQDKFFARAHEEALHGRATTVFLCPARTDTRRWFRYVWDKDFERRLIHVTDRGSRESIRLGDFRPGVEVRFLPGRIRFVGAKDQAPFPGMLLILRAGEVRPC